MLLRSRGASVPDTNAAVFRALDELDVIDGEAAGRMARAAGLRNALSHQNGADIDDRDVFNSLQTELDAFPEYLAQIRDHIE